MSLKNTIKRHTFLLLSGLLVLGIAGGLGYGLSLSSQQLLTATMPATNSPAMVMARFVVYTVVYACWDSIVMQRITSLRRTSDSRNDSLSFGQDLRLGVLAMIIAYEGMLVQKLPVWLIASFS